MSNLLNGSGGPAAPDYMQGVGEDERFGEGMDGGGFPRLAFKGSRFRIRQGDEETVLRETELPIIILRDYPAISRLFFDSGYDADGGGRPSCASADGVVPISTVAEPQSDKCANCPQNEKGSAITDDGRKSRACSFYKRLVVLVRGYEDVGPVVCDVKSMSLFGDSKPNDDLWSLKAYFRRLQSNNVKPFQVWTEVSFDVDSSVPKVFFRALEWADEGTFTESVSPLIATPDGRQQLEDMADTSTVRTGEDEEGGSAMQDKLLSGDKPKHLEAPTGETQTAPEPEPEKELSPQQKAAITRKKNAAKKKAEEAEKAEAAAAAASDDPKPAPEPTEPKTEADSELDQALADFGF